MANRFNPQDWEKIGNKWVDIYDTGRLAPTPQRLSYLNQNAGYGGNHSTTPPPANNGGGGGGGSLNNDPWSRYLDQLNNDRGARDRRYRDVSAIFNTREGELDALKGDQIGRINDLASDENIERRAGEYKQSYLDQILPEFARERKRGFLLSRQDLAQKGVGVSSVADDRFEGLERAAGDTLNNIESRAFQLGADRETQDRSSQASLIGRIMAAHEADLNRNLVRRNQALQELLGGGSLDLSYGKLGVDASLRQSILDEGSRQFDVNDLFRVGQSDSDFAFKEWFARLNAAGLYGATAPTFRG